MQTVDLNIIPGAVIPVVNVSQYDVGRQYGLQILDGNSQATLTGYTVLVEGKKSDGNVVEYDANDTVNGVPVVAVSGNVVTITTPMQMCAAQGRAQMKLKLSKNGNLVHTMKYYLDCDSDPQADGAASESDIPAIIEAATRAETAASNAASKALVSEGYANGTQNGSAVPSTSPYYHNNAKWYKDNMTTLDGLSDTTISSPANGQMLYYDASAGKWKNGGVLIRTTDPGEGSTLGTGALLAVVE